MSLDRLIPAEKALEIVLAGVEPIGKENVETGMAANRCLAEALVAKRTQPPFDASAMDGFAVRSSDVETVPTVLELTGTSRAGEPFDSTLNTGCAVRIFTGAVVPDGADAIVVQENAELDDKTRSVRILQSAPSGKFIRKSGLDFQEGETLLQSGQVLNVRRLALAAAMNYGTVPVFKKPVVAIMATGDELVKPGTATGPGQIIASNTYGLKASIEKHGGIVLDLGIVADTQQALREAFDHALSKGADLIVTTGGASVGDHDLVKPVAEKAGFTFEIAKIAMRPGKPFLFGRKQHGDKQVYLTGLAGNPVSSLVAYSVFTRPLLLKLGGFLPQALERRSAQLGRDLLENDERAEYMRAELTKGDEGQLIATPYEKQDSSMLSRFAMADCLVYRPVSAPAAKRGTNCEIVLLD